MDACSCCPDTNSSRSKPTSAWCLVPVPTQDTQFSVPESNLARPRCFQNQTAPDKRQGRSQCDGRCVQTPPCTSSDVTPRTPGAGGHIPGQLPGPHWPSTGADAERLPTCPAPVGCPAATSCPHSQVPLPHCRKLGITHGAVSSTLCPLSPPLCPGKLRLPQVLPRQVGCMAGSPSTPGSVQLLPPSDPCSCSAV